MDELGNSFSRLSTDAGEWKPGGDASDLRAKVKEFVPGQGWSTAPEAQKQGIAPTISAHSTDAEYPVESTRVAGPTPAPSFRAIHSLGLGDEQWRHYREIAFETTRQMPGDDQRHKAVPLPYCNAYCLDDDTGGSSRSSFGYLSSTFVVTNREDGHLYCLRRLDNVRSVSPRIAAAVEERWSQLPVHSAIVPLHRSFVASRAVFFVHDYVPGARSLSERLQGQAMLSEPVLWSCITQIVSAMRVIHQAGLAVRSLDPAHILSNHDASNSRLRLRINCVGVVDAVEFEARKAVVELQQQDVRSLGRLILSLATGTTVTARTDMDSLHDCEAFLAQNFSRELHNLAMTLINTPHPPPSIRDISLAIAPHCFEEQDAAYLALDRAEQSLAAEYESGRALRLLLKLGFCNERPESGPNRRWAQSGDCYVLTLFRDFVFHQADGAGNPIMDLGHVVSALNKLDAADEEKIVLSSRDGKSLMVMSYADVARCLENAFHELCTGAVPPTALQY